MGEQEIDVTEAESRAAAELAYQHGLAALHDARAELAELDAARRRLAFDEIRLDPDEVAGRQAELAAGHDRLTAQVERLREEAEGLRQLLRRYTDAVPAEPLEPPAGESSTGFEQPPHFGMLR